jgi:hypothetical protein
VLAANWGRNRGIGREAQQRAGTDDEFLVVVDGLFITIADDPFHKKILGYIVRRIGRWLTCSPRLGRRFTDLGLGGWPNSSPSEPSPSVAGRLSGNGAELDAELQAGGVLTSPPSLPHAKCWCLGPVASTIGIQKQKHESQTSYLAKQNAF